MMNLTEKDYAYIERKGMDLTTVQAQLNRFETGFPFAKLNRPAVPEDGIHVLSEDAIQDLAANYRDKSSEIHIEKFVPASGAASRMFKHLFEALEGKGSDASKAFLEHLSNYAFYDELVDSLKNSSIETASEKEILSALLNEPMNLGSKPKALIPFHKYNEDDIRLSLEEHFLEGASYASGNGNKCHLHFTVSPSHLEAVQAECELLSNKYLKSHGVTYEINFSAQESKTDTIAVNTDNSPFRKEDGSLLFRPGGHGALLLNLEKTKGDILFIKNIDNVCVEGMQPTTKLYKEALAGLLIQVKELTHDFIESGNKESIDKLRALGVSLPKTNDESALRAFLDRPIRVCGMVKNQGEPGGGPFWVEDSEGEVSLQIVEKAQVDLADSDQVEILSKSTHFNPVDLICSVRKPSGELYKLEDYRDDDTGFISDKSLNGKDLKAMELPGLWNGAMANWITLFVEVPLETFNPVKTVNDLVKPAHQPG